MHVCFFQGVRPRVFRIREFLRLARDEKTRRNLRNIFSESDGLLDLENASVKALPS
jgi:hypothetical protein